MIYKRIVSMLNDNFAIIQHKNLFYIIQADQDIKNYIKENIVEGFCKEDFSINKKATKNYLKHNDFYTVEDFSYDNINNNLNINFAVKDVSYVNKEFNDIDYLMSISYNKTQDLIDYNARVVGVFRYTGDFSKFIDLYTEDVCGIDYMVLYRLAIDNECTDEYYVNALKVLSIITYVSELPYDTIYPYDYDNSNCPIDPELKKWIKDNIKDDALLSFLDIDIRNIYSKAGMDGRRLYIKKQLQMAKKYVDTDYKYTIRGKRFFDDVFEFCIKNFGQEHIEYLYLENQEIKELVENSSCFKEEYFQYYKAVKLVKKPVYKAFFDIYKVYKKVHIFILFVFFGAIIFNLIHRASVYTYIEVVSLFVILDVLIQIILFAESDMKEKIEIC